MSDTSDTSDTSDDFYQYEFFGPAQAEICGNVDGLELLDVGCGSGYFPREMARRGARVTGVDISPRMIALAQDLEAAAPMRIAYHAIDAADLSGALAPQSFDIATSCLALQDMPRPLDVLRSVRATLRTVRRVDRAFVHELPFRAWERDADRRKRWLCIDRYFDRGPREYTWNWPGAFTTVANHAPLEDLGGLGPRGWIRHQGDARTSADRRRAPCSPRARRRRARAVLPHLRSCSPLTPLGQSVALHLDDLTLG